MANTLLVYKGEEVIKRQPKAGTGKTTVTIEGLSSNTEYTKGTYKLAWSNGATESAKVDVPAFTTNKVGVTTVTATPATTSITVGNTQQISSEVAPANADDKTLTYTSNNEPVATVDGSGLITAVKAGNATITVKSNDNATATAKVSVTVEKAVVNVTGVTLDATTATMNIGDTKQLSSTVAPENATDKTVTYTSKAQGVASVDNKGLITAKAAGTAQIVATTKDGAKTATCDVTVEEAVINVSSVELTPATATLDVGATQQLSSNVLPSDADNKKVTYSTGSDAIATVSATGLVTAVGEGTTDITVTTEDGAKTAVCTLTVTAKQIPVTGVTLDKSTLSLEVGATETLNATVAPSNASYKAVGFTSSDEGIATVDNDGLVTAVAAGSTDITVESIADGSKTAVCTLTVTEPPEEVTDPPAE